MCTGGGEGKWEMIREKKGEEGKACHMWGEGWRKEGGAFLNSYLIRI